MDRWERRERKQQAAKDRMPKVGMSVRLLQRILLARAAKIEAATARSLSRRL